jgi:trimeric autotransporter adhesin
MRARAVNQHYLGQNTLRDLDAEYAAGGAPNQSHAPRAANVTLNLNTANVPQLLGNNSFSGNQWVNGTLGASGAVTGASFQIGSNPFAFGSYANENAFLGFSGNTTMSGEGDTAIGWGAFSNNTVGNANTAIGGIALAYNTTGYANTAIGGEALYFNSTGSENTGMGMNAGWTVDGSYLTGSYNTAVGYQAFFSTGTLTNATVIGANAVVSESNALILGKGANVGIGTSAPGHLLDVAGTTAIDSTGLNNGTNFIDLTFGANAGEGMSSSRTAGPNQYGIDIFTDFARRISIEQHGNVGIGTTSPDNLLTVNGSADKPGGGSWGTYSDGRLKNLNGNYSSGLSQILRINPIRYRYKADNAMGIRDTDEHIAVVAQEVQQVIPEAVTENSKGYLLVNNDPIIWSMLNAIKEQQEEIRAPKSELRATQRSLQKVETQVAGGQPALVAAK